MRQKIKIILLIVFSLMFIFSCKTSQETPQTGNNTPPNTNTISMRDNSFSPATLTIDPGTTVRWVNNGSVVHTATSGTRNNADGMFNSGDLRNGNTFEFTFNTSGTFDYHCFYHVGMDGTIIVR